MTKHAWDSYTKYAWPDNELDPVSKIGMSNGIFGTDKTGATIIDSLDTLYIMNLTSRYEQAKNYALFDWKLTNTEFSIFEINIRYIGGFLAAFSLTNDKRFLDQAEKIANFVLPAFDTPTGIPYIIFNPATRTARNYDWAGDQCSILADIGTLHLEFATLSKLTGNEIYLKKVENIREKIENARVSKTDLYKNFINADTGQWCKDEASVGALGDSYYEYLINRLGQL